MLKKIAIACVGVAITGQSFAQTVNPLDPPAQPPAQNIVPAPSPLNTFVGEIQGIPVVFQVRINGNSVSGHLIVGSEKCPLSGTVDGVVIDGTWQAASGKTHQFRSTIDRGVVTLVTNGKTLTLRPANQPAPANNGGGNNEPRPQPEQPAAGGDAALDNVTIKVGEHYTVPLPSGYRVMEGPAGTFVGSEDGKSGFGVIGVPLDANESFEQFQSKMIAAVGVQNPSVFSTRKLDVKGGEGVEQILGFTGRDGVKRTGVFRVVVLRDGARPIGMIWHAATPSEQFEANIGKMMKLAVAIKMNPEPQPANVGREQVGGL